MATETAAAYAVEPKDADGCFALGMNYSIGANVAADLIEAHKWFNIAAMRGHADGCAAAPRNRRADGRRRNRPRPARRARLAQEPSAAGAGAGDPRRGLIR